MGMEHPSVLRRGRQTDQWRTELEPKKEWEKRLLQNLRRKVHLLAKPFEKKTGRECARRTTDREKERIRIPSRRNLESAGRGGWSGGMPLSNRGEEGGGRSS